MSTFERMEQYLRATDSFSRPTGNSMPEIRYFDGIGMFCTLNGEYKAKTLENSLKLFLQENWFI